MSKTLKNKSRVLVKIWLCKHLSNKARDIDNKIYYSKCAEGWQHTLWQINQSLGHS